MRVLTTGAGGMTGRRLVEILAGEGHEVHTLGSTPRPPARHHDWTGLAAARAAAVVAEVRPEAVLHLAGTATSDSATTFAVNFDLARHLLDALDAAGLPDVPVLVVGTAAEYGVVPPGAMPVRETRAPRPVSDYGASKACQTALALSRARRGRPIVVARPSNLIGRGMPEHLAAGTFLRQVRAVAEGRAAPVIETGDLSTVRDFIAVDDAVRAYWDLVRCKAAYGRVVHVSSGSGTRIGDVLDRIRAVSGVEFEVRPAPSRMRRFDVPVMVLDASLRRKLIGDRPLRSVDETIEDAWNAGGS